MTSRLPSVWPAYMNNELYFFDDAHLKERNYTYTSNYGMIPLNIILDDEHGINIPSGKCLTCSADTSGYTYLPSALDKEETISGECSATCKCRVISFERISKIYGFFKDYYYLLHHRGHCNVSYSSATDFYSGESANYAEEMPYGTFKETYVELDEKFNDYGGSGFCKWISDYVIPTYTIPKQYQDYWQRETLYYPDVIKWIGWFNERYAKYGTNPDCKSKDDCCDCTEYVNRGGYAMIDEDNDESMESWYHQIQDRIICGEKGDKNCSGGTCTNCLPKDTYDYVDLVHHECYEPFYITPISIQSSIDDLGEMSIFCEEYKEGVDYRTIPTETVDFSGNPCPWSSVTVSETIIHYESGNTHSGTSVMKDGKIYQLTSGSGYIFDSKFMEKNFDDDGWNDLTAVSAFSASGSTTISGYTASKLKELHVDSFLTDDIGNTILGVYDVSGKTNHQPQEGEVLEPIYQPGVITNIKRIGDSDDEFIGDTIQSMSFYYKPIDLDEDFTISSYTISGSSGYGKAVSAITDAYSAISATNVIFYDDVFCDVVYSVGDKYKNNQFKASGVVYTETVQFVKEKVEYYLKQSNKIESMGENEIPSNHSISYPIYIYKLKQDEEEIRENTYDTPYLDSLAEARVLKSDYNNESGTSENPPMFREEYKLGMSAPQNVSGDIYIDRGINSAFEKHIKISEVVSLEDMLQYGNGYFKIMDN